MVKPRISRPTARIASSTSRTVRLACFCFCLARARLFRLPPCFRFWDLPPELRPLVFCFALLRREALPEVPSFFLPAVLWPDFTRADLDTAIEEFNHRSRRFGGI